MRREYLHEGAGMTTVADNSKKPPGEAGRARQKERTRRGIVDAARDAALRDRGFEPFAPTQLAARRWSDRTKTLQAFHS